MSSRYTSTRGTFDSPGSWRYSSSSSTSSSSRPSSFEYSSPYSGGGRAASGSTAGYGRSSASSGGGSGRLGGGDLHGALASKGYSASPSPRSYDTGVSSVSSPRSYDTGVSSVSSPRSYDYGLRSSGSTDLGTRYVSRSSSLKGEDSSDGGGRLVRGSYARSSIPTRSSGDSPRGSRSSLSSEPSLDQQQQQQQQGRGQQGREDASVTDYSSASRRERLRAAGLASSSGDSYRSFSSSRDEDPASSASLLLRRSQRATQNGSPAGDTAGDDSGRQQSSWERSSWRQRRGLTSENGTAERRSSEADSGSREGAGSSSRARRTQASTDELLSRASALRRSRRQQEQEEREKEEKEEREKKEKKEKEEREKKEKEEREKKEREKATTSRSGGGIRERYGGDRETENGSEVVSHPVVTASIFTRQRRLGSGDATGATQEDGSRKELGGTAGTGTASSRRRFRGDKDTAVAAAAEEEKERNASAAKPEESSSEPRTFRRYGQRSARTAVEGQQGQGQGQAKVEVTRVTGEPRVELQKTAGSLTISERLSSTLREDEAARKPAAAATAQEDKTSSSSTSLLSSSSLSSSSAFTGQRRVPPATTHGAESRADWKDAALSSTRQHQQQQQQEKQKQEQDDRSGRGDFTYSSSAAKHEPESAVSGTITTMRKSWREEAEKARALTAKGSGEEAGGSKPAAASRTQTATAGGGEEVGAGEGPVDPIDARAQRIARYKEERRQQLESLMASRQRFLTGSPSPDSGSGSDTKPSLFLSCSSGSHSAKGDDSDDATASSRAIRRSKSAAEKHAPLAEGFRGNRTDWDSAEAATASRRKGNLTRTASSHIPRQTAEVVPSPREGGGREPVLAVDTSNVTVRTRRGKHLPAVQGEDSGHGGDAGKTSTTAAPAAQQTSKSSEPAAAALGSRRGAVDRQRPVSAESQRATSPSREADAGSGAGGEGRPVERSPSSISSRLRRKLPDVKRSASDAAGSSSKAGTAPIREALDTARITYFRAAGERASRVDSEAPASTAAPPAAAAVRSRGVEEEEEEEEERKARGTGLSVTSRTSSNKLEVQTAGGGSVTLLGPTPTVLDELLEKNRAFLSDVDASPLASPGSAPRLLSAAENPAGRKSLKRRPGHRSSRTGSSDSDSSRQPRLQPAACSTARGSKEDAVIDTPTLTSTEVKVEVRDTADTATVPSAVVRMTSSSVDGADVTTRTRHHDVTRGAEPATTTSTAATSLEVEGSRGREKERDGERDRPPISPSRRRAALRDGTVPEGGAERDLHPKSPSSRRRARRGGGDSSLGRDEAGAAAAADNDVTTRSPASRRRLRHGDSSPSDVSTGTGDKAGGRRRFITRPPDPPKDSGSDSVFDTAPSSAPSSTDLPRRSRQRKDKSGVRKSELNKSEDNEASNQSSASVGTDKSVDKISAAVHLFQGETRGEGQQQQQQQAEGSSSSSSSRKTAAPPEPAPQPRIPRRQDFSQLVKKFSSSEGSSDKSDKSDAEKQQQQQQQQQQQLHRRPQIRRQHPVERGSSSDESNTEYARRTPERSQSLRMQQQAPAGGAGGAQTPQQTPQQGVRRTGSFQSRFMRERFDSGSDQPSPELAAVLSQRKTHVAKQQEQQQQEGTPLPSRAREEEEGGGKPPVEREETRGKSSSSRRITEVIADQELASVLRSRRKETDSNAGLREEDDDEEKKAPVVANKDSGGVAAETETTFTLTYSVSLPGAEQQQPASSSSFSASSSSKSSLYSIDSSLAKLTKATQELDTPPQQTASVSVLPPASSSSPRPPDSDSDSAFASSDSTARRGGGGTLSEAVQYIRDVETSISSRVAAATTSSSLPRSAAGSSSAGGSGQKVTRTAAGLASTDSSRVAKSPERQQEAEEEEATSVTLTISLPPAAEDSSAATSSHSSSMSTSSRKTTVASSSSLLSSSSSSLLSSSSKSATTSSSTRTIAADSRRAAAATSSSSILSTSAVSTPNLALASEREEQDKTTSSSGSRLLSASVTEVGGSREGSPSSPHTTCTLSLSASSTPRLDTAASSSSSEAAFPSSRTGGGSGLRRAESLKDWSSSGSSGAAGGGAEEARRGIIKRTPSLPRQQLQSPPSQQSPIIDPQLAMIMKMRREREASLDEEEEEQQAGRKRTLSAAEEIELARRERRTSTSSTPGAGEGEGGPGGQEGEEGEGPVLSVAERIHLMKSKLEETHSTPRSRSSGHTTPRSPARTKSGPGTPVWQLSIEGVTESSSTTDDVEPGQAGAGRRRDQQKEQKEKQQEEKEKEQDQRQLLAKLSSLASEQEEAGSALSLHERRQRFQRRQRDDWRTRTQPVTQQEVSQADSLESVSAFRALVRRQATINMFDKLKGEGERGAGGPAASLSAKRPEFPQHLPPPSPGRKQQQQQQGLRQRQLRHKTLPITAAELSAIPEGESLASHSLRSKVAELGRLQAQADSGIVSGSELEAGGQHSAADCSLRSLSLEMDVAEDDPSRLTVSAKASIFRCMEEKTKAEKERNRSSASGAKRYIERKKRERSMTQPVTEEEVKDASELAVEQQQQQAPRPRVTIHRPEVVNRPKTPPQEPEEPAVQENDELTKLSLKDKVRLFSEQEKAAEEKAALPPTEPPVRRRPRKHASRFSTQPVTVEEVQEAATTVRVTPLMMSLVKPPEPELLAGLPINAQRDLAMQHAQEWLAQHARPRSQPGSQPGSRRTSLSDGSGAADSGKAETKGILKSAESLGEGGRHSPEQHIHGILKSSDSSASKEPPEPRSILKRGSVDLKTSDLETKSILKHSDSAANGTPDPRAARAGGAGGGGEAAAAAAAASRGILKNSRSLDGESGTEPKSILKQESAEMPVRGILKRESSFEAGGRPAGEKEGRGGALKKSDSREGEEGGHIRGILKRDSVSEDRASPEADGTPGFYLASEEREKEAAGGEEEGEESDQREDASPSTDGDSARSRRRVQGRKNQGERYKTQPVESTAETPSPRRPKYYEGRHMTQPVTPDEMKQAEASSSPSPVAKSSSSGSIADRLQALKRSGEEDWRRRVAKSPSPELLASDVKLREKVAGAGGPARPSSIADRLNALEGSQASWRARVEEGDASKFTVAGRLTKRGDSSTENSPLTSPTLPAVEFKVPIPKHIISAGPLQVEAANKEEEAKEAVRVEVPSIADEELDTFFQAKRVEEITEKIDVSIDDFNNIFIEANDLLSSVRRIRPNRKQRPVSRNPLKTMSVEVRQEYTEVSLGVADREMKRIKREKVAGQAGLAEAALAGLASQENFSKVELRRTEEATTLVPGSQPRFQPYSDLMLLHFKGRRNLQVRLVEPVAASLNSGDCFVLVTPDKVINWVGDFANVIEKARSADVALYIQQKRDLGCRAGVALFTVEEAKSHLGPGKQFWAALGGRGDYMGVGPDEEDELFESTLIKTNAIYRLKGNALLPYEEYWGCLPKFAMLQRDEVLVFDFGSELYVWMGKSVEREKRKLGLKLAQQLWEKGYDYSECVINPLCPLKDEEQGGLPMQGKRPDWALFGKISQNMETILFREKFSDWPDSSRLISVKGADKAGSVKQAEGLDLKPHDAKLLVPLDTKPVTLVLEGSNVGRGDKWLEDMEGFIREQEVMTLTVTVWHVMEYDHFKLDTPSYGQMHDGDTYVVRWQYMISAAGHRSRFSLTGRERCAYFFWQGRESTINEKGASALMTVELDEERGPQVRVVQGKEPPCFLHLFGGAMAVHRGKREDASTNTSGSWRLFALRGGPHESETCLLEIPLSIEHFRSRSSLLLLDVGSGSLFLWHGCQALKHTRALALAAARKLQENKPKETGLEEGVAVTLTEVEEGSEPNEFWRGFTVKRRNKYCSLRSVFRSFDYTLRLFLMTSVSGTFEAMEVLNPSRDHTRVIPFPFLQADLYKASQPALFLLDNHHEVYLWQGWWPVGSEEQENVRTGSAHARFNVDRRCAMETTLHYCKEKNPSKPPPAYMVYAGAEPLEFTNLFPFWEVDKDVMRMAAQEGRAPGETPPVEEVLARLTKSRYTLQELQADSLPEGVDPLRIESYLEDKEFQELFEMTKEEYYELQPWRQRQLKQQVGLF